MKFLLTRFFSLFLFTGVMFSSNTESNTGWSYIQSVQQFFYMFASPMNLVDVYGNQIEAMEMDQIVQILMNLIVD